MNVTRRQFFMGCSAAIAAMSGGRIENLLFAEDVRAAGNDEILISVFLRGGMDGLNFVAPFDDSNYVAKRGGGLAVPASAALAINPNNAAFGATSSFGLHPQASGLQSLYQANKLAIVHAAGLNDDTRSHFDAMDYMERGTPGNKSTSSGWLTRHLRTVQPTGLLPTLAASSAAPASLLSNNNTVALTDPGSFDYSAPWRYNVAKTDQNIDPNYRPMIDTLRKFYGGTSAFQTVGRRAIETVDTLNAEEMNYTPEFGAAYPGNSFGNALKLVAQMIKLDVGLRIATVDFGGWDTHEYQGNGNDPNSYYSRQIDTLSRSLYALYNDLSNFHGKLTVVVMSEFGRRLGANGSNGTDHGHGNVMLVLGGNVNGGKMYGKWPGLADDQLDQRQDLAITTDYRQVLSEILVRRLDNPKLGMVFPGYKDYKPLNITGSTADDLPIDYTPPPVEPTPTNPGNPGNPSNPGAPKDKKIFLPITRR